MSPIIAFGLKPAHRIKSGGCNICRNQRVTITHTAVQFIVGITAAVDGIIAITAVDGIIAGTACKLIITITAVDGIIASTACKHIVAITASQGVITITTL